MHQISESLFVQKEPFNYRESQSASLTKQGSEKMGKGVTVDEEAVKQAYNDVRDDANETTYVMLTYQEENTKIG